VGLRRSRKSGQACLTVDRGRRQEGPGRNLDDKVPRGTLNSILKQSGLKEIEKDD